MVGWEGWRLSVWCVVAAFGTYFCMYAFRKPFTAATFSDVTLWGLGYKSLLVTAQVLGYMVSKFLGIKIVAEISPRRRVGVLLLLIAGAELALLLFAITPPPWNMIWLFVNGLPLGMVFGLVLGFLEGRRHTEALAAGLCASFIVADGAVKSVGATLLDLGISEFWMPALAGLLFVPPLFVFAGMLLRIPPPTLHDQQARTERVPMNGSQRWDFFRRYATGLTLLILVYLLITILRSVRADFAPEIWTGLQGTVPPAIFAQSETIVGAVVLLLFASMIMIQDNRRAFFLGLAASAGGVVLVVLSLGALQDHWISPFLFMVLHGIGLYLPYIAVHTLIFERLIALTRDRGTIGYLMYLADSFGYLGYVGVLLARNLIGPIEDFVSLFLMLSWLIAGGCLVLLIPCWRYFARHPAIQRQQSQSPSATLAGSV
jgi:hypothetical protein